MNNNTLIQSVVAPNWYFLTFGAGKFQVVRAASRLANEAKDFNLFKQVYCITSRELKSQHKKFWEENKEFINTNPRGFGYWLWKPYLINYYLQRLPPNSVLLYCDAGCHLNLSNNNAINKFITYFALAEKNGFLTSQLYSGSFGLEDLSEKTWTRKKLIDSFQLPVQQLQSGQIQATFLFVTNNTKNRELIQSWLELCTTNDHELLIDSKDEENYSSFIEHRHDQSVFSLLAKSNNVFSIPDETYWAPNWRVDGRNFPIWAMRHKSGVSPAGPQKWDLLDRFIAGIWNIRFIRKFFVIFKRAIHLSKFR